MRKKVMMGSLALTLALCSTALGATTEEAKKAEKVPEQKAAAEVPAFSLQYPPQAQPHEPHVEIHMDERFAWGKGTIDSDITGKNTIYMSTLRTRLWLQGIANENSKVTAMVKDERSLRSDGSDTPAYMERLYADYNKGKVNATAGRMYYWIDDGNVFENLMDGARVRYGTKETYGEVAAGRIRDAYQDNGNHGDLQGYILRGRHTVGKVEEEVAYYDFKKHGGYDSAFNKQKVFSARTRYYLGNSSSIGWEYLNSKGETPLGAEQDGHGYVWSLNFGDEWAQQAVKNSYCVHLRYYNQPRSSFIKHTMDAYPNMFGSLGYDGFKGWGLYSEYVLVPGVQLALELYDLKGRGSSAFASRSREKVVFTSVNFYF